MLGHFAYLTFTLMIFLTPAGTCSSFLPALQSHMAAADPVLSCQRGSSLNTHVAYKFSQTRSSIESIDLRDSFVSECFEMSLKLLQKLKVK